MLDTENSTRMKKFIKFKNYVPPPPSVCKVEISVFLIHIFKMSTL